MCDLLKTLADNTDLVLIGAAFVYLCIDRICDAFGRRES